MKRNEIVSRLIKEGFSEKTLVNFSDKQLANLSERMFNEVLKVSPDKLGDENVKAAVQAVSYTHLTLPTNREV